MVISGESLQRLIKHYNVVNRENASPRVEGASVDLHLSNQGLVPFQDVDSVYNIESSPPYEAVVLPHTLLPGEMILTCSEEIVALPPNVAGLVTMRSTAGRLGLDHAMAGWIDPGFRGSITFELQNIASWAIELRPGDRVVQLILFHCDGEAVYDGRYNNPGVVLGANHK